MNGKIVNLCLFLLVVCISAEARGQCTGTPIGPALPMPLGIAPATIFTGPDCLEIGANGFNAAGPIVAVGAARTESGGQFGGIQIDTVQMFTGAPSIDVISGGSVTSHSLPGTTLLAAGIDCIAIPGQVHATSFAVTDTAMSQLSALLGSTTLPGPPILAVSAGKHAACGGRGFVLSTLCVQLMTDPRVEPNPLTQFHGIQCEPGTLDVSDDPIAFVASWTTDCCAGGMWATLEAAASGTCVIQTDACVNNVCAAGPFAGNACNVDDDCGGFCASGPFAGSACDLNSVPNNPDADCDTVRLFVREAGVATEVAMFQGNVPTGPPPWPNFVVGPPNTVTVTTSAAPIIGAQVFTLVPLPPSQAVAPVIVPFAHTGWATYPGGPPAGGLAAPTISMNIPSFCDGVPTGLPLAPIVVPGSNQDPAIDQCTGAPRPVVVELKSAAIVRGSPATWPPAPSCVACSLGCCEFPPGGPICEVDWTAARCAQFPRTAYGGGGHLLCHGFSELGG